MDVVWLLISCFDYEQAVDAAVRILKEGGMDAIKLEGGAPSRITAAKAIVEAGIAVMGHVGLTPQAISVLGGFRPQGRNVDSAVKVLFFFPKIYEGRYGLFKIDSVQMDQILYRLWRLPWLCKKQGVLQLC